ncbi:hypothetical protein Poli38472_009212 [Pythium oligandrum]|uniref:MORN repeat protein n=1 Tax=Pythium oligandrum TaxID=41045 RepID=A0A8K1CLX2_PYTOL|nr:hypothetical protein Poli38472_009212 [Pythium oligandrum]|eukprot:TMW65045.1 hypothetical protein Poli38472_009212 [Pythium oligandrum]
MATKTGRLIVHAKTGEMVEEMKEDLILVALYDPSCEKQEDHTFQRILRSDFKLRRINELFDCNASLLKDPFGNVLWPKDWVAQVLPPSGKDKWFYIIHERLEPPPQDDLNDPMYAGSTVLFLASVPKQCEALDLRQWLLFGISQDYEPLAKLREEIQLTERKRQMLKQKMNALPSIDVDGNPEQQAELRKKLSNAISSHTSRYDQDIAALSRKKARIEKFLMTEPLLLTALPIDKPTSAAGNNENETLDEFEKRMETRSWTVQFQGPRGEELVSVALEKSDWTYICLAQTRPTPKAFVEADHVEHHLISDKDLQKEINMRSIRLRRLRHGQGELLQVAKSSLLQEEDDDEEPLKPWDEDFHISSIGAMYKGEWRMGEKHGRGQEYTNVGFYDGEFEHNFRHGRGKLVYGKGSTVTGTFERRTRRYEYASKYQDRSYAPSLLNGDAFREGIEHGDHMRIEFPDGAIYEGEMTDGKVTGFGKYTSSTGVVDEGYFHDGLLHGKNCSRRYPDGTLQRGSFVMGQLHGRGVLKDRNGDEYDGFFEEGVKSGRGVSYFDQHRCKHVGFWFESMMDGRGDCFFKEKSAQPSSSNVEEENQLDDEDWDFWYEGSFIHGETQARHRCVDLKQQHKRHLPFTTNNKSVEKMPFITSEMPQLLRQRERRRQKNNERRSTREKTYLQQQEYANLSLYYGLLDEFYEKWVQKQRERKEDEVLDAEELERVHEERAAAVEYAENRLKFRKEKYNLSPRKRDLPQFESYLERVTLTERVVLERAMAAETSAIVSEIEKAGKAKH